MKSLILVRHAKSDWNLPTSDRDRTITEAGQKAITIIAKLSQTFLSKDFVIWSSVATRAKQTAELFCATQGIERSKIIFHEALYTFDAVDLENQIKKCDNSIDKLILFGHNEAITNFVNKFGDVYISNVPTAGLVYLQIETENWQELTKGKIIQKLFPKEI